MFQLLDLTSNGRGNALYAARTSADSFWKVGVKHGWWRGVKNGDVIVFAAGLALYSMVYEARESSIDSGAGKYLMKMLRGEAELGLANGNEKSEEKIDSEKTQDKVV